MRKECAANCCPSEEIVVRIMILPGKRKRFLQDAGHCFPPCKRFRAELNYAGKTRHGIDDAESPTSAMKHSAIAKSAIGRGRPYRPSYCKRYRRPMIRVLSANARKSKMDAVDAPFGIARDDVRHILRHCHAQDARRKLVPVLTACLEVTPLCIFLLAPFKGGPRAAMLTH